MEKSAESDVSPVAKYLLLVILIVRSILLTAVAAILGMVPIRHDVVWRPMAFTIVIGLADVIALILLFLPAVYVTWFRIKQSDGETPNMTPQAVLWPRRCI